MHISHLSGDNKINQASTQNNCFLVAQYRVQPESGVDSMIFRHCFHIWPNSVVVSQWDRIPPTLRPHVQSARLWLRTQAFVGTNLTVTKC